MGRQRQVEVAEEELARLQKVKPETQHPKPKTIDPKP